MTDADYLWHLRRLVAENRPTACLGCGQEHGCSLHGCAVLAEAVRRETLRENRQKTLAAMLADEDEPRAREWLIMIAGLLEVNNNV